MPQEIFKQVNFNVGEMDPRVANRDDLKVYFAALEYAENLMPLPVGPIVRRPGLSFIDYARHTLTPIAYDVTMITAPEGGTVADAVSADGTLFTTTAAMGAADYVVLLVDFGHPVEVALIDLIDYAAHDGSPTPPAPAPFTYPWPGLPGLIDVGFGLNPGIGPVGEIP